MSPALGGGFFTTRSPHISVSHSLESLTLQTLPRAFLPSHYHLPSNLPLPCISDYHLANSSDLTSLSPSPHSVSATPIPPPSWGAGGVGLQTHLAVLCIQAPDVRAGPQAEIGVVPLGFMNPLPAQVLPEVNVELTNTAVLFCGAAGGREKHCQESRRLPLLPWSVCVSPWLPSSMVSNLVSLAPSVVVTAVIVVIIAYTDKALPLVQHCTKSILISVISGSAQNTPVRHQMRSSQEASSS